MTQSEEWVTIAEAARRLCLSDRHTRRLAAGMSDKDRQRPTRGAVRVRLSALAALSTHEPAESDMADIPLAKADSKADIVAELRKQLADMKADKDRLNVLLDRRDQAESELRRLMLADRGELMELRKQVRLLSPAPPQEAAPASPGDTQERGEAPGVPLDGERKRAWWQVWKREK